MAPGPVKKTVPSATLMAHGIRLACPLLAPPLKRNTAQLGAALIDCSFAGVAFAASRLAEIDASYGTLERPLLAECGQALGDLGMSISHGTGPMAVPQRTLTNTDS